MLAMSCGFPSLFACAHYVSISVRLSVCLSIDIVLSPYCFVLCYLLLSVHPAVCVLITELMCHPCSCALSYGIRYLLDEMDRELKGTAVNGTVERVFGGTLRNVIGCLNCHAESVREVSVISFVR